MKPLTVVGSLAVDHVTTAPAFPSAGETIMGDTITDQFGGKGANQAVAAARLGATVYMIGAVGDDTLGTALVTHLKENQVETTGVATISDTASGQTAITVAAGENSIIVLPGANHSVTIDWVKQQHALLDDSSYVLVQNEIPRATIEYTIDYCSTHHIPVIYNPAPALEIDASYWDKVAYLTPNERECATLFPDVDTETVLKRYPNKLILTRGKAGACYYDGTEIVTVPAHPVAEVVDTTGAGDAFNGALAVALSHKMPLSDAIAFAELAAAYKIQMPGAEEGLPTLEDLTHSDTFADRFVSYF